ncbi:MAG: Holliday junction branch migration protein RuvA [Pelosinus sp.]|nr:Holliday junction branch migration protein RuvA [Pelosinus sp.]
MIGFLHGIVTHIFTDSCFLDVQGVGYRVFVADTDSRRLVVGEKTQLFTYLSVREDALLLYGFYTQDEYDLFIHLISVSGIGPKVAMGILSTVQPDEFKIAICQKNIAILTKLPGIGKKTAERIILELKDKLGEIGDANNSQEINAVTPEAGDSTGEAVQALTALGYSQAEAMTAIKKLGKSTNSVEELIKLALKELSRR